MAYEEFKYTPVQGSSAKNPAAAASVPVTNEEKNKLLKFKNEAIRLAANTPAIRERVPELWGNIVRGGREALLKTLEKEGLAGTKVACMMEAACSYLDHDTDTMLRCCKNAGSFGLGMQLAEEAKLYEIAQRMAEEILNEVQEEVLQMLCRMAVHTGNAQAFCELFTEYIEAASEDESLVEYCEVLSEYALFLLEEKGIEVEISEPEEILNLVCENYAKPLPSLNELLRPVKQPAAEESAAPQPEPPQVENQQVEILQVEIPQVETPPAPPARPRLSYEELKRQFEAAFRRDKEYREPDANDMDKIWMLDQLLEADAPDVGEYRMPLLVRVALQPQTAGDAVKRYIERLEKSLLARRRQVNQDRRWRLFKAIDEFIATGEGLEKAKAEAKGKKDELNMLKCMEARR